MSLLADYVRERMTPATVGGLAALVALASGPVSVGEGIMRALLAAGAVAAWRVRDDRASVDEDRARHPTRVLARAGDVAAVRWFGWGLLAATTVLVGLVEGWAAALGVAAVAAGLEAVYWAAPAGPGRAVAVLLKYPLLAALLAGEAVAGEAVAGPALLMAGLVKFEVADDAALRRWRGAGPAVALAVVIELAALAAVLPVGIGWVALGVAGSGAALLGLAGLRAPRWPAVVLLWTGVELFAPVVFG
ncbi:MAG: hypothetical protein H6705_03965 [Myxococcales bacterium]|nr:hypothetical protein [Myxococcales bacterium]